MVLSQIVNLDPMRILFLYASLMALPFGGFAQSLAPRVVASGGIDVSTGGFRFSAVVGEAAVAVYGDGSHFLTVGFEQPFPLPAPLPLEWLSFTGRYVNGQVELEWITAREFNTDHFDVERSADGGRFDKIGEVAAAGNSTATTTYRTTDAEPVLGKNYYRLRQVDVDGRSTYSPIILVETSGIAGWSAYPNPAHGHFALAIRSTGTRNIIVDLYNPGGQIVASRQIACSAGTTVIEWNLAQLAAGLYFIRSRANELPSLPVQLF